MINPKSNIYIFASLFLVLIIDAMGIGLILPLLGPLFLGKTSAIVSTAMPVFTRDVLYGVTLATSSFFMFFGAPFLGDLSDHIGRKKVLLLCLFGTAFGLIVSALGIEINSVFLLVAGRAVAGFMAGSQALAQAAIVDISTEKNKTTNLSLITFASCFGFVLGPVVGGLVSNKDLWSGFSIAMPFWFASGLAVLNGLCLLLTFHETFYPKKEQRLRLTKGAAIFISAFTSKTIKKLVVIFLLAELGFSLYFQALPLYVIESYRYSTFQISYLMALMGGVFGFTLLVIVRVIEKYIEVERIIILWLILVGAGTLMVMLNFTATVWLSIIPVAIGGGLFYVALLAMFSNSVDKDSQGWVMGVFAAVAAVAWGLSGLFSGVLESLGSFMPFIIAGSLLLISAILSI